MPPHSASASSPKGAPTPGGSAFPPLGGGKWSRGGRSVVVVLAASPSSASSPVGGGGGKRRVVSAPEPPPTPSGGTVLVSVLPPELLCHVLTYLPPSDLLSAEASCKAARTATAEGRTWERLFKHVGTAQGWRAPSPSPRNWRRFFHEYRKDVCFRVREKVKDVAARFIWRVPLPPAVVCAEGYRVRSREVQFSRSAHGGAVRWQAEVEVAPGPQSTGAIRLWTTNDWTPDMTTHYYGSHCTVTLLDSLGDRPVIPERSLDIDGGKAFEFNVSQLAPTREVVLRVDLSLALEVPAPLPPLFALLAAPGESESVKVGYCRAIFEVARCKRRHGSTFVDTKGMGDVVGLVHLAGSPDTGPRLREEVLQALFNLLSPAALLMPREAAEQLAKTCLRIVAEAPVPPQGRPEARQHTVVLVQNALGTLFNLLIHPATRSALDGPSLLAMENLFSSSAYHLCQFSVVTIMLTALSWGRLPSRCVSHLHFVTLQYMRASNPLNPHCTGVAWDETDIAAYFLPLLMSRHLLCVSFAQWCISTYYYQQAVTVS